MNQEEFENVVHEVMASLPDWVHAALDNIDVLEDEADEDIDPDGEGFLGLYLGLPLPERGADYAGELPDVKRLREEFAPRKTAVPQVTVEIPAPGSYDALLPSRNEDEHMEVTA